MRFAERVTALEGKRFVMALAGVASVAAFAASTAGGRATHPLPSAYVQAPLYAAAQAHPQQVFRVILEGAGKSGARQIVSAVRRSGGSVDRTLRTIEGASARVTGQQLVQLAGANGVAAITADSPVRLAGGISSTQQWPTAVGVRQTWSSVTNGKLPTPPAIAIVDSGVQAGRVDFGNGARVIDQTTIINSGTQYSPGDGYGHGTFVAGIAAGSATSYAGAAPSAPLVSVRVLNDQGMALTSDVIAACDWIVQHKSVDNIRVANFSLHSTAPASVFWDPLDRAVEKLWFDGITVVAAAGNYGTSGQPSGVLYAPGNDPFVITVGADDLSGSVSTNNDSAAPWSAWGHTYDGFAKPEVAAPGRYMIGPVPANSTLATSRPDSVVSPGYMELSGTSFATPIVSGIAAFLLANHPDWTPDQIKGAIMLSAKPETSATPGSVGVGLVDAVGASQVTSPPNANLALDKYVGPDPNGGSIPVFNSSAWQAAAAANPAWDAAAWGTAAWGTAAWGTAAWGTAAWGTAAWETAAWGTAAWGTSTLAQSLSDAAWGTAASGAAATADAVFEPGHLFLRNHHLQRILDARLLRHRRTPHGRAARSQPTR